MKNETVRIEIQAGNPEVGWTRVNFVLPAFTQEEQAVAESVQSHLSDYLAASAYSGDPMSVGDFTLWLIRRASETEPMESNYAKREEES